MADKSSAAQDFLDEGMKVLLDSKEEYYEDSINLLCMLLLSGNWWRPDVPTGIGSKSVRKNRMRPFTARQAQHNTVRISYSLQKAGPVQITLYASSGKTIYAAHFDNQNKGKHTTTIAPEQGSVSNGICFCEFVSAGEKAVAQVSIVK